MVGGLADCCRRALLEEQLCGAPRGTAAVPFVTVRAAGNES